MDGRELLVLKEALEFSLFLFGEHNNKYKYIITARMDASQKIIPED